MYNLTPALISNLEPSVAFKFLFLRRTSDDYFLLLNLTMVRSPLILWQSSRSSGPQGLSILFKISHTVVWRFLSSIETGMPTISIHSLLLYCSWACRLLSSVVIRFRRLSITVLTIWKPMFLVAATFNTSTNHQEIRLYINKFFWIQKWVSTGNSSSVRGDKIGTSNLLKIYASVPIPNKVGRNGGQLFIPGLCTLAEPRRIPGLHFILSDIFYYIML